MSRAAAALGLLALLGSTACVEPVPGLPLAAVSDAEPYDVRFVAPGGLAAAGQGGALDAVTRADVVTVAGWVPAEAGELLVVAPEPLELVSQRRVRRPDAAEALRMPDVDDLGFELVLRPVRRTPAGVCVLFRADERDAPLLRLPGATGGDCGLRPS